MVFFILKCIYLWGCLKRGIIRLMDLKWVDSERSFSMGETFWDLPSPFLEFLLVFI